MEEVSSMQTGQIYTKKKRENKEPNYKEAYHKPTEKSIKYNLVPAIEV
jgi:hypothetical protein